MTESSGQTRLGLPPTKILSCPSVLARALNDFDGAAHRDSSSCHLSQSPP